MIWDISGQEPQKLQTLFDHTNSIADIRFSPNGACLATTSLDRTAKVWDAQTGQLLLNLPGLGDWGAAVAFGPTAAPAPRPDPAAEAGAALDRCGQWLATASLDGVARLWAIGPNHEDTVFVGHRRPGRNGSLQPRRAGSGDRRRRRHGQGVERRSGQPGAAARRRVGSAGWPGQSRCLQPRMESCWRRHPTTGRRALYDRRSGELQTTLKAAAQQGDPERGLQPGRHTRRYGR